MSDTATYYRIPTTIDDKLWMVVSKLPVGHAARDEYAGLLGDAKWGLSNRRRLGIVLVLINTFGIAIACAVCAWLNR